MTIFGYRRVSTTEQAADDKSSIDQQGQRIQGAAMMRGETDVVFFSDLGVSGSIVLAKRPDGAKMLAQAKRGDIIIASKLDRLFRSASDALTTAERLEADGIGVVLADIGPDTLTQSGTAKLFFSMLAAFAEFERTRIAERMADGRRGKQKTGGHIGGEPPYGYKVEGKGRAAVLVPVPEEQQIASLVVNLRPNRSLRGVCAELNRRGLKSRVGTPFGPAQVERICNRYVTADAAE